jgi:antitoxin CptB
MPMSKNETIENKRKRLIFRSEHRGTKEMDLIMGSFARKYVPEFSEGELAQYEELLLNNDPDLYNWLTLKEEPPANVRSDVFDKLMAHKLV